MSTLSHGRRDEYRRLFDTLEIRAARAREVDREADRAQALRGRYEQIGEPLGVPWFFIAAVHMRETSFRLDRHLHNGDPLTAMDLPRSGEHLS